MADKKISELTLYVGDVPNYAMLPFTIDEGAGPNTFAAEASQFSDGLNITDYVPGPGIAFTPVDGQVYISTANTPDIILSAAPMVAAVDVPLYLANVNLVNYIDGIAPSDTQAVLMSITGSFVSTTYVNPMYTECYNYTVMAWWDGTQTVTDWSSVSNIQQIDYLTGALTVVSFSDLEIRVRQYAGDPAAVGIYIVGKSGALNRDSIKGFAKITGTLAS